MGRSWAITGMLAAATVSWCAPVEEAKAPVNAEAATVLVREVIYNELHDHDSHGFWRYWVQHQLKSGTRVDQEVETCDGPVTRVLLADGHPLDSQGRQGEEARLRELMGSKSEQANLRQAYQEDEARLGRILSMLPDAFLFEDAGYENGLRHMRFRPNPAYAVHSMEARIFHAMSGDLWVDTRLKRLARLDGRLVENVDFGFGLFGRLYKGGWFRVQRTQVSKAEWKIERLEVHLSGKAMLFRTLARETSEVRGGFQPVPPRMSVEQGVRVLEDDKAVASVPDSRMSPAALVRRNP